MSSLWRAYPSVSQLRSLINQNAEDLNSRHEGQTLLHRAAIDNNTEVIRFLSQNGADLNKLNYAGKSALNLGLEKRHFEVVALLLELGADPNNATINTESTLHQAAAIKDPRFIQRLFTHGAKCKVPDRLNDWPIHRASLEEYLQNVGIILHSNAEHINSIGNRGLTPLHIAATNSNVELFALLIEHGADIAIKDLQGRTPLDLVIMNQDNTILDTYGYLLANKVAKCKEARSFSTVFSTPASKTFLETLTKIDNEYRRAFVETETDVEYFQNRLDDATNEMLLNYIESDERIDINEFVQIIIRAVRNGLVDEIISKDLVPKIAESIFRHVLVTENEILLQELMNLGVLWGKIVQYLEKNIIKAYEKTLVAKRVGIRGLVWRECLKDDDEDEEEEDQKETQASIHESEEILPGKMERVSYDKLHMLVSKTTKLWQLRHTDFIDDRTDQCDLDSPIEVMKDPVQTLALWSVLTGRFKLTPHLLRQEPYDLIPQALLMAKLLRSLSKLRGIEDVYRNKATNMANTCEGIAIQALRRIKEFDTSQNNILTMEYLRLPLRSYGDYDAIDLAARGGSSNFVTIDVVQDTLDMFWYSDFFFVRNKFWKMEAAIIMGFVPPLMLLLPLIMERFRQESPTFKNPEISQDSKFVQVKSVLHNHDEHQAHEMTGVEEHLLPQPEVELTPSKPHYVQRLARELNAFYDIPCVKFRFHVTVHVLFVLLLSFVVMRLFSKTITIWEGICYLCLFGFLVEEINEIIKSKNDESLASYFSDGWNLIDLTAILCGAISFFLRLDDEAVGKSEEIRYWALVLLSTTCLVYWIRLLFVSVILQSLGPKLKMMALMVKKDFLPFLYILFILMIGFGVVFQALLYPPTHFRDLPSSAGGTDNETSLEARNIAVRMFKTTFFMIVGEYGLDDKEKLCTTENSADADEACVHETGSLLVTNIFMVIYIVIVQILLLNVIVAMFSETIDAVNRESTAMWQFEKYDLTQEFFMRSKLPPPFNVVLELRRLIAWIVRRIRRDKISAEKRMLPRSSERNEVEVFLYYLYYQAISCRGQRSTFRGVVIDEEDLDEGNAIIFEQIKDIQKELKRLRKLESLVQKISTTGRPQTQQKQQLPPVAGSRGN